MFCAKVLSEVGHMYQSLHHVKNVIYIFVELIFSLQHGRLCFVNYEYILKRSCTMVTNVRHL